MVDKATSWTAQELRHADLGDARLNRRMVLMVEALAAQPSKSVRQAMGDTAATKGAYRFWDSPHVQADGIREAQRVSTRERCGPYETVLAIQDTTSLDFTHHPATKGMGPLDAPSRQGIKAHSVLMASTEGVPLGMIFQKVWSRDPDTLGIHHRRRTRQTKEKESQRWLTALGETERASLAPTRVVTIADREADIYDLMAAPRRPGSELLIRATHQRRVSDAGHQYLWEAVRGSPVRGELVVELPRREDRPPRVATLNVRYTTLSLVAPHHRPHPAGLSVPMGVMLAEEEHPTPNIPPICWLLFTTLSLTTMEEAVRYIRWYTFRWLIKRYHYVLKSGCHIEELQLEQADRLERALATYCIVAWRLLWLPDATCTSVLDTHEWQSLYCTIHKTPVPPQTPPTLHEAVRWIAKLGGFLGRRHDGVPGAQVIWRGFQRLHDIAATWKLVHLMHRGLMGNA